MKMGIWFESDHFQQECIYYYVYQTIIWAVFFSEADEFVRPGLYTKTSLF